MPWRGNFWAKLVLFFYTNYTANQEALSPCMQKLREQLRESFGTGVASESFRAAFRKGSLPLMKYTNILSFNWRSIALFVSVLIGRPWLYFMFELVILNAILIYMISRHESLCRKLTRALKAGKYS